MRIIDPELWDKVKAQQDKLRFKMKDMKLRDRQCPRYLLSGLVKCGHCGGGSSVISQTHMGCSSARNKGTCTNCRIIKREALEEIVLGGPRYHLMTPDPCKVWPRNIPAT